jgi:hypothetical protein
MLAMVRELYAVEDEANAQIAATKDCTPVEADAIRLALRQAKSVPILATIKAWLDSEQKLVLPDYRYRSDAGDAFATACSRQSSECARRCPDHGRPRAAISRRIHPRQTPPRRLGSQISVAVCCASSKPENADDLAYAGWGRGVDSVEFGI